MQRIHSPTTVAQTFCPVKSEFTKVTPKTVRQVRQGSQRFGQKFTTQFPLSSDSMIHHKVPISIDKPIIVSYRNYNSKRYGVSWSRRAITSSLFIKKFDYIRDCLQYTLGLTVAQREVVLRLFRYWAYYGNVYPKEAQITLEPGCKKATFWRTIRLLKELGLLQVVNRFVVRPHAQISNLYRLDRLALLLARYLAEHGAHFWEKWLRPILAMPGQQFWSQIFLTPGERVAPWRLAFEDP